jgi:hypothetical protein
MDVQHLGLFEVDLPEYGRAALGRALLEVWQHVFDDGHTDMVGVSICAATSRSHLIHEGIQPIVVGPSHEAVQSFAGQELIRTLYALGFPVELVTLGVLRHGQFDGVEALAAFLRLYHVRASWLEAHPTEVLFSNIEADTGLASKFDWTLLLPESEFNGN